MLKGVKVFLHMEEEAEDGMVIVVLVEVDTEVGMVEIIRREVVGEVVGEEEKVVMVWLVKVEMVVMVFKI